MLSTVCLNMRKNPMIRTLLATRLELEWLAGFVDGEGSFSVKNHDTPMIVISQSGDIGREVLRIVQTFLGYGHIYHYAPSGGLAQLPVYVFQVWGLEAI